MLQSVPARIVHVVVRKNSIWLPSDRDVGTCFSGVEVWRGGLGAAYRFPTLSSVGASLAGPCFRFHTPLIEPDVRICRIRLSEKTHAIAEAIACDAACNF